MYYTQKCMSSASDHSLSMLGETGCRIVKSDIPLSDYAVLDSIVWYGGIPLLGKPSEDACSLRIIDADIAHELANERIPQRSSVITATIPS